MRPYAPKVEWLLRMGDSTLILGHRLSEWCGHAPVLEEDLALANTALDLLGQSRRWLGYAGQLEGEGRGEDELVFKRDAHEYRNFLLVEQENGNYADTVARQFYFDCWHDLYLRSLAESSDATIADIARRARVEVTFHLRRSSDLVIRLGDGTAESHARMQAATDEFWIFTGELFAVDAIDEVMTGEGVAPNLTALHAEWLERVRRVLSQATLSSPAPMGMRSGGKQGMHGEVLGYLLAEMQFLPRAYPDAKW